MKPFVNSMIQFLTRRTFAYAVPARSSDDVSTSCMSVVATELLVRISGGEDVLDSPKGSWGLPPVTA
jgi:hypothetical protein